jgi:lysophospholipase L1-like esterase
MRIAQLARSLSAAAIAVTLLATTATTAAAQDAFHNYVALGDSYTSGPFIPVQSLDPLGCGRSNANYASVVAARLKASLADASCAGADTSNMTASQSVPFSGTNKPQFSALRSDTGLVTVGIGGNDFGVFGDLTGTCPTLRESDPTGSPCEEHYTSGGVDTVKAVIANITPRVQAVLTGIHERSPGAAVYVIGYPRIAPERGYCPDVLPFADGDYAWLNSVEVALNAAVEEAVNQDGSASFVDTYGPSRGHDACARGGAAWINGKDDKLFAAAAYHPYKAGMAGVADIILKQLH